MTETNPLTTKAGLPRTCPSWCVGDHKEALDEGCRLEDARVHQSVDLGGQVDDIVNFLAKRNDRPGHGGWRVMLKQDVPPAAHVGMVVIELEVHTWSEPAGDPSTYNAERLRLTTSEARTVAAQLLHLADRAELQL